MDLGLMGILVIIGILLLIYVGGYSKGKNSVLAKVAESEAQVDEALKKTAKVAEKHLKDSVKVVLKSLTPNNYATSHKKLESLIVFVEKNGFSLSDDSRVSIFATLESEYKAVLRKEAAKERQREIKEQIREEQRAEKEIQTEIKRMERAEVIIKKALDMAMAKTKGEHSVEIEALRKKLAIAEARMSRARSMAQQTKAGNVYVISNIGSFGKDTYKVGMTRRLEPMDRVKELSDASVPFSFDVHMMISCDDAPALENALHKALAAHRVNKVNLRKEFFNVDVETIAGYVEKFHGSIDYVVEPEALEYTESKNMTSKDADFVHDCREDISAIT